MEAISDIAGILSDFGRPSILTKAKASLFSGSEEIKFSNEPSVSQDPENSWNMQNINVLTPDSISVNNIVPSDLLENETPFPKTFEVCEVCGMCLCSSDSLKDHLLLHKGDKERESIIETGQSVLLIGSSKSLELDTQLISNLSPVIENLIEPFIPTCAIQNMHNIPSKEAIENHLHIHNKGKTKVLYNDAKLTPNKAVKNISKPYLCSECSQPFPTKEALQNHASEVHFKVEKHLPRTQHSGFICKICNSKAFSTRKELRSHSAIHKIAECELCGKTFAQWGNLKTHMRTHTKEKPYCCDLCGKSYSQAAYLRIHSIVHTGDKPYLCEFCGLRYDSKSTLAIHNKVHTQERPHTCKVCMKSFKHSHHLKKHYTIHTQEKPYICEVCNKAFSRPDYLKEHIRVHTKEKPYKCKICGKGFSQGGSLKLHYRVHTRSVQ